MHANQTLDYQESFLDTLWNALKWKFQAFGQV